MGQELIKPLEFVSCISNSHETKYELKGIGCKNSNENKMWSFNKITNVLTTDTPPPGIRKQILQCNKT